MKQTRLILVGGFLGAGKTTLIGQAGGRLLADGRRVGFITNDQASDLVDTEMLNRAGLTVQEIAGGCFCCRFSELMNVSNDLVDRNNVEVLMGEPVGSCTDLSATVLQPIKDQFAEKFCIAPFTVVADPLRLREVLDARMRSSLHPSARYIIRKQLEEADIVVINKIDLLPKGELSELQAGVREMFPDTHQICLSALTGAGVSEWLDMVLRDVSGGGRIAEVDYDVYAEGEAVLGWLNATVSLASEETVDWKSYLFGLMTDLQGEFRDARAEVGHVKVLLTAPGGQLVANLTRLEGPIAESGSLTGDPKAVRLIINARVQMSPEELECVARRSLHGGLGQGIRAEVSHMQSLSPGRPMPAHRYTSVIV